MSEKQDIPAVYRRFFSVVVSSPGHSARIHAQWVQSSLVSTRFVQITVPPWKTGLRITSERVAV